MLSVFVRFGWLGMRYGMVESAMVNRLFLGSRLVRLLLSPNLSTEMRNKSWHLAASSGSNTSMSLTSIAVHSSWPQSTTVWQSRMGTKRWGTLGKPAISSSSSVPTTVEALSARSLHTLYWPYRARVTGHISHPDLQTWSIGS